MHVFIIGGGGFLGGRLARELIQSGGLAMGEITRMTLLDVAYPVDMPRDRRLECVEADFTDGSVIRDILLKKPQVIFHLAAVVSGAAEKNFDLGMRVNFQASLQLLQLCRELSLHPRIVFASSIAVFGGDVSRMITEDTSPKPRSSYGTQKAMVELLMNDYSRKGFIDGRCLRLPTIAIRPGKPNAATSSFVSSIIREPLSGKRASYPVPPETEVWIQSPRRVIQNFIHAANIDEELLGDHRTINLPGLTVSIREMIDGLEKATSPDVTGLIVYEPDDFLQSIVLTWPAAFDTARADGLGFVRDSSSDDIIRFYIEEENPKG